MVQHVFCLILKAVTSAEAIVFPLKTAQKTVPAKSEEATIQI